jgi:hypothetical protein
LETFFSFIYSGAPFVDVDVNVDVKVDVNVPQNVPQKAGNVVFSIDNIC